MKMGHRVPKVLLVSPKPPPGHGAAKVVETLLGGCGGRIDWAHVDARYAGDISDLQRVRLWKFVLLSKYLWQTAVGSLRCDVVVLTPSFQLGAFFKDSLFIWGCWLLRRRVLVGWYHMSFATMRYDTLPAPVRFYVRLTLRRLTHHACVSERLIGQLPRFIDSGRVVGIANGTAAYEGGDRVSAEKFVVLYLSHMGEAKGWRVLMEAAGGLCEAYADLEFHFYGGPAYETSAADIEEAFASSSCPSRIRYMGYADEDVKRGLFREADALCFPSMNEAFPITILEAMSAGLPVVASNVGGIGDALVHGKGGLLLQAGDAGELRAALATLLGDVELSRRWGRFNRERYRELFSESAYCSRWCDFLEAVA